MAGNVAFMFLCTIMVLGMTPGLGMFYGGMVRRKNALNTMMFCFAMMGIGILLWVAVGYSLCFGEDHGGIIGNLHYAFLQNVPWTSDSDEVPPMMLALFNMMFAVISPAIILGSLAERMKFSKMMLLCIIWTLVVYYPLAHMTWGGGFLDDPIGSIDFAGGNVIHISTGVSGLVACMILGKRKGFGAMSYHPHNIPLFLIGAAVLWVGWLGFNCGCAGGANEIAILALANTTISSAASMVVWMLMETILQKKCTVMGAVTGGIVGLVGITPGAGYVPIWSAFLIGAIAAPICFFAISKAKQKFGYDDALDAFGCHGVGGIWGGIATGLFANSSVNAAVPHNGLAFGEWRLFVAQLAASAISIAIAASFTAVIMLILKKCGGVRVSDMEEAQGLDQIEHGERAYPAFNGLD